MRYIYSLIASITWAGKRRPGTKTKKTSEFSRPNWEENRRDIYIALGRKGREGKGREVEAWRGLERQWRGSGEYLGRVWYVLGTPALLYCKADIHPDIHPHISIHTCPMIWFDLIWFDLIWSDMLCECVYTLPLPLPLPLLTCMYVGR